MLPVLRLILLISLILFYPLKSSAYEIPGEKWIGARTDFYFNFNGSSPLGLSWNVAFTDALNEWNTKTPFKFSINPIYIDPCEDDDRNGVQFSDNVCGQEFDEAALAVTMLTYEAQILGPPAISEADIFINQANEFEIYDGSLKNFPNSVLDFRRIVLHELGHVIGLGHEPNAPAIMKPSISNIDRLQDDDIEAVEKLYGGKENCIIKTLKFGITRNSLSPPDCTVMQFTVGSDDDSHLDIYSFSLDKQTNLEFSIKSTELEAVLLIADEDLNYLASDTDVTNDCNALLKTELISGNYFLIVNTWNVQMKPACDITGPYELVAGYSTFEATNLGKNISLKGGVSNAIFTGGIKATEGQKFGNIFKPTDSIDISAQISIDLKHQGRPGFIVVAAVIDEQILLLDENGDFIDTNTRPGIIFPAIRKTLESEEQVEIIKNLVAAELGINEITVDFVVGYGLDDDPDEIFYHETPLNLTIQ